MKKGEERRQLIANPDHPWIARIRRLQARDERERGRLFFADGVRFVAQAIQHGAAVETLVAAPALLTSASGQRLVEQQRRVGRPCLLVTAEVYRRLSLAEAPQGLGAVVGQRWEPLARQTGREGLCWLALETVQSPGNLGTIIRQRRPGMV